MTDHNTTAFSTRRKDKVRALLAGGLVLGVGAAFTLAAWTDNEWVFGGAGPDDENPGTKTYAMEQNTVAPFAEGTWTDEPDANGGYLDFTVQAASLLPGDTVYAPFQLRAKAGSEALTVSLAEARQALPLHVDTNSAALYGALTVQAWVNVGAANCSDAGDMTAGTVLVAADSSLNTAGADPFDLPAGAAGAAGDPVNLCFALTLPAGTSDVTLQGKNVIPLWRFTSVVGS
jgi:predicted ribosomally synthesized peptide with SipW-like signal peptide